MKYQYQLVSWTDGAGVEPIEFEDWLNRLGSEGWELSHTAKLELHGNPRMAALFVGLFKRRVLELYDAAGNPVLVAEGGQNEV